MKKIVNLTTHTVKIVKDGGEIIEIPPSGQVARVELSYKEIDNVDGIPIIEIQYGDVIGLPKPQEGVYYVVSSVCKNAVPDRKDVLALFQVQRQKGEPFLAKGFRVNG